METQKRFDTNASREGGVEEIWRKVEGNMRYSVSSLGRVRRDTGGQGAKAGRILIPGMNGDGYPQVRLGVGIKGAPSTSVHALVAIAFISLNGRRRGIDRNAVRVNHIDGNPSNNNVSNLEWVTNGQNVAHAYRIGLVDMSLRRGSKNWQAKLTEETAQFILDNPDQSTRALAAKFNVSRSSVCDVRQRRSWRHINKS